MHPIDQYSTIQRGLEELRRQAEQERLMRAAKLRKRINLTRFWRSINWAGTHLVRWGKKLERVGTPRETLHSASASPHH